MCHLKKRPTIKTWFKSKSTDEDMLTSSWENIEETCQILHLQLSLPINGLRIEHTFNVFFFFKQTALITFHIAHRGDNYPSLSS